MNFSHLPAMHQFATTKFGNEPMQAGTMLVTSASDGTLQYVRPELSGVNFLAPSSNSSPLQGIPVSIPTSTVGLNVPVAAAARSVQVHQQQQQLTAMVNQTSGAKFHSTHGTLFSWGEVPIMHHFNEASKNITINVPYTNPTMNSATILTVPVQPPTVGTSPVWPVKLMQNVSTMTVSESELQPQDLCKAEDMKMKEEESKREKEECESEDDSDDSSKSSTSETEQSPNKETQTSVITNGGGLECHQIQLQQQGSAMADYLARLQPAAMPLSLQHFIKYQSNNAAAAAIANVSEIKREESGTPGNDMTNVEDEIDASKKKKKKKIGKKPPRPKPGEIRLSTALDGSTLFCCPECCIAYPDRTMLEEHMVGHKQERRFVCNVCGACLKRKEHLDQHKRGHSDERPYVCSVCMKGFKRNEHLTRHYVIHSGNKNHSCVECGKAFSRKDHLHKHAQTHIAKRVKAEMSQASSGDGNVASTPTSITIPHIIHHQPLTHTLHLHQGMS